jgi:hypothetical protein
MMRRLRLGAMLLVALASITRAHDGGFGHSRRTIHVRGLQPGLSIEYRIVLNRDEALAEMALMDVNKDGQVRATEREKYFVARGKEIASRLLARTTDGKPILVKYTGYSLDQALAQTYQFSLATEEFEVLLEDRVFPHKPGLVQVRSGGGVKIEQEKPVNLAHAERVTLRIKQEKP